MNLTFAEEFLLLALDDRGCFVNIPAMAVEYGLAGALLMELAIMNRIDADLDNIILVNADPTGDALLDSILAMLATERNSAKFWIKEISIRIENLRDMLIQRLVEHGILKMQQHKVLWVFSSRRYPCIDNREEEEVKARIRRTVLSNDIPDPRDIVLISLVYSCDLVDMIFTETEQEKAYERIEAISKMDLIGQAVNRAVLELHRLIAEAVTSVTSMTNPMRV